MPNLKITKSSFEIPQISSGSAVYITYSCEKRYVHYMP